MTETKSPLDNENKTYECGDTKAEHNKEKLKALKEVALGTGMFVAGALLYKASFNLPSERYMGGAAAIASMGLMGSGISAAGKGALHFIDNSPKTKKALVFAYNNSRKAALKMDEFTSGKLKPFVTQAIKSVNKLNENVIEKVKPGMDNYDENGKYINTLVDNEKYVKQPKIAQGINKILSNLTKDKGR